MNRKEYLLTKLIEEASEVIQAATKIQIFGEDSFGPGEPLSNKDHLEYEIDDLAAIIELLADEGLIATDYASQSNSVLRIKAKREKVERYYEISKKLGTVQ